MQNSNISSRHLAVLLEQFLADAPQAVAIEDGELLFEFATAKYSVSGEGKCILHLWSENRNAVRRVLSAEEKGRILRLSVLHFGQSQPVTLEICADGDRRKGTAKLAARTQYQQLLRRVLLREYPGFKLEHLSSAPILNIRSARCTPAPCCGPGSRRLPCLASMPRRRSRAWMRC